MNEQRTDNTLLCTCCLLETVLETEDARVSKTEDTLAPVESSSLLGGGENNKPMCTSYEEGADGIQGGLYKGLETQQSHKEERRGLDSSLTVVLKRKSYYTKSLCSLKINRVLDSRNYFFPTSNYTE